MPIPDFLRAVFALALTLGLVGLCAVALRKYGPEAIARFGRARTDRRMKVVESLVLDPARRLLIVECDGEERLVLLGEGQLLSTLPAKKARA